MKSEETVEYEIPQLGSSDIVNIVSPDHLYQVVHHPSLNNDTLIILMCKAKTCRPCKMFMRKYERFAQQYPGVVFMQIFGDATMDTRKLMMSMGVKVTPTFRLYINEALAEVITGTNEQQVQNAIDRNYSGVCVLASFDSMDEPADGSAAKNSGAAQASGSA